MPRAARSIDPSGATFFLSRPHVVLHRLTEFVRLPVLFCRHPWRGVCVFNRLAGGVVSLARSLAGGSIRATLDLIMRVAGSTRRASDCSSFCSAVFLLHRFECYWRIEVCARIEVYWRACTFHKELPRADSVVVVDGYITWTSTRKALSWLNKKDGHHKNPSQDVGGLKCELAVEFFMEAEKAKVDLIDREPPLATGQSWRQFEPINISEMGSRTRPAVSFFTATGAATRHRRIRCGCDPPTRTKLGVRFHFFLHIPDSFAGGSAQRRTVPLLSYHWLTIDNEDTGAWPHCVLVWRICGMEQKKVHLWIAQQTNFQKMSPLISARLIDSNIIYGTSYGRCATPSNIWPRH